MTLLTADQMRQIENAAIDSGQITGLELMERAGRGVVSALLDRWPDLILAPRDACVLCGPGNNGGDGFVIARLLRALGWRVRVHLFGDPLKLPQDARTNHDLWVQDSDILPLTPEAVFDGPRPDVIVDAVFGNGLTRALPEPVAKALDPLGRKTWNRSHAIRVVAVDCPSGLDLDQGRVRLSDNSDENLHATVPVADLTVTFHAPKIGHYIGVGPFCSRQLKVVDIGLPKGASAGAMLGLPPDPDIVRLIDPKAGPLPLPGRVWPLSRMGRHALGGHKYNHGHVMVFSGGVGRGGAARLAARAALRVGAGLVTVVCPPSALIENACQLNAIMLKALAQDAPVSDIADNRVTGFVLGPGMGVGTETRRRVLEVLSRQMPDAADRDPVVVLDADALTSFADDPAALFGQTHARVVLTPHEGEFARLFPDIDADRRATKSKVEAVRQAAARAGCIVLLKGPDTVIADPQGGAAVHAAVYDRAVPWLATAGAGDVLAGLIAGLASPSTAGGAFGMTEIAAYLHVEAARSFGPGLIAEDLPEELPKVLRRLSSDGS